MKKGVFIVFIVFILNSNYVIASVYRDNFQAYKLGTNTLQPVWIPQYSSLVEVVRKDSNKFVRLNYLTPFNGDRDLHIELNRNIYQPKELQWAFRVIACNSTWKKSESVTPQGASAYLYYYDENNFIDVEFKVYANSSYCGDGLAQLSAFKRVNRVSTPLIPYTRFPFIMNRWYRAKIEFIKYNLTHYNYTVYLDNTFLANSLNISLGEIKEGRVLLENGGTVSDFDEVSVYFDMNSKN